MHGARRPKLGVLSVMAAVCAAAASVGCVDQARYDNALEQVQRAREEAQLKQIEIAALREREAALNGELRGVEARVRDITSMQAYMQQIQALVAKNTELALRLQKAELGSAPAGKTRDGDDASTRSPKASDEDADVRRSTPEKSDEAIRELLRSVQALVDSGQVKVTVRDGHLRFHLPRRIDETDPYSAPRYPQRVRPAP